MEKKILIVDDESAIIEVMKDFLDDQGYQTFTAADAVRGLELVELEQPELVFLDILMPEISGLECLAKIKAIHPETIVVMISGMQDEGTAKEAISKGAYDYVTKPFNLEYLENSILARIFPK